MLSRLASIRSVLRCRRAPTLAGLATAGLASALMISLLGGPVGADAAAQPTLRLSPASGAAGSTLRLEGSGFPRRQHGLLYFGRDDSSLFQFETDRRGRFVLSISVPDRAPDSYVVDATVGDVRASATFTITDAQPRPTDTSSTGGATAPPPGPAVLPNPSPTSTTPPT